MMKQGNEKEIWRHAETKGKQAEWMWLPVPICKILNSPESFLTTPTFTWSVSPEPRPSSHTLIMLHTFTFEVALHAESFYEHCQGSQPGNQNVENGTARRRLGRGTDLHSRSHRQRRCTSSKAKIKEKPPQKNQSGELAWKETAQRVSFGRHGTSSTHARLCQRMQKCKDQKQTHTLQHERGWDVEVWDSGERSDPLRAQVAL